MHASKGSDIMAMEVSGSIKGRENALNNSKKLLIVSKDNMLQ